MSIAISQPYIWLLWSNSLKIIQLIYTQKKGKKAHLFFTVNTFLLSLAVLLLSTTEINVLQTVVLANITQTQDNYAYFVQLR